VDLEMHKNCMRLQINRYLPVLVVIQAMVFLVFTGGCLTARGPMHGACRLPVYALDAPVESTIASTELAELETLPPGPVKVAPSLQTATAEEELAAKDSIGEEEPAKPRRRWFSFSKKRDGAPSGEEDIDKKELVEEDAIDHEETEEPEELEKRRRRWFGFSKKRDVPPSGDEDTDKKELVEENAIDHREPEEPAETEEPEEPEKRRKRWFGFSRRTEIARIEQAAAKLTPTDPTESANSTILALAEESPEESVDDYRINPKDDILIEVFGEPEISQIYHVSSEGFINHPLLKKVQLAGLTAAEAEEKLRKMLAKDYLVDPRVNLRIKSSLARRVIIFGEVEKPGSYEVGHEQPMTLLRVISMSGGFTDLAAISRVRILRDLDGEERTIKINVADLLKGRLEETDIELKAGDIITVPETIF